MSALGLVMHPLVVATELISDENEAHDTPAENVWRRDNRRFDDVRPAAKVDPDLGPAAHQERDVVEQFLILRLGRAVIALECLARLLGAVEHAEERSGCLGTVGDRNICRFLPRITNSFNHRAARRNCGVLGRKTR